jgi:hypothetical protein
VRLKLHCALLASSLLAVCLLYVAWLFRPIELPSQPHLPAPPPTRPTLTQEFHAVFGDPAGDYGLVTVTTVELPEPVKKGQVVTAVVRSAVMSRPSDEFNSDWSRQAPLTPCARTRIPGFIAGGIVTCIWYARMAGSGREHITFIGPPSPYVDIQLLGFENVSLEPE